MGKRATLDAVVTLLAKHEGKMASDVRLANNYFEALFQTRQLDRVTKLLNAPRRLLESRGSSSSRSNARARSHSFSKRNNRSSPARKGAPEKRATRRCRTPGDRELVPRPVSHPRATW